MIFVLGFVAQLLFFLRTISQWILSERAKKVISPSIYWVLSIIASYLFFVYGWLRNDFAILLGQSVTYYIYIWNLNKNGLWQKIPGLLKLILLYTPLLAVMYILINATTWTARFFQDQSIPVWLIIYGSIGQIIFTSRFIYQFIYSIHKKESLLPLGFWLISLLGSSLIFSYGVLRNDPVLMLGQSFGMIVYIRNLMLHKKGQIAIKNN